MQTRASILINRPVHEVFAFVADLTNQSRWQPGVVSATVLGGGPVGVGTRIRVASSYMGRSGEGEMEVTEFLPDERISFRTIEPVRGHGSYAVRPDVVRLGGSPGRVGVSYVITSPTTTSPGSTCSMNRMLPMWYVGSMLPPSTTIGAYVPKNVGREGLRAARSGLTETSRRPSSARTSSAVIALLATLRTRLNILSLLVGIRQGAASQPPARSCSIHVTNGA